MFILGDQVQIDEEFEGSVTIAGWDCQNIEDCVFEIVSIEEFQQCHPQLAKKVKARPTKKDTYLRCIFPDDSDKVFVMYPSTALAVIEPASPVCRCPIKRLWAGMGHYTGCAET
jgi:hypothetical protein